MAVLFWICFIIVFYTYLGYPIVLFLIIYLKRIGKKDKQIYDFDELPEASLIIAAYNEEDFIKEKIENTLSLKYPKGKLEIIIVTDGSSDATPSIVKGYEPQLIGMHSPERAGKMKAIERAMKYANHDILIFTDANTFLNEDALVNMVRHYKEPLVGGVAGEKRVMIKEKDKAASAGEGIYWKYESKLKKWDSDLYSVVGAAGELYSVRRSLHPEVPPGTIIEDFYLTLKIAESGYQIRYEPEAYAMETGSENVKEELKRKIRISAGGIQAISRLTGLLNPFKHGWLTFQYISHRALRWTLTPLCLLFLLITNAFIVVFEPSPFWLTLLVGQLAFYILAGLGYLMQSRDIKLKVLFVPYYFFIMNFSVYLGFIRFLKGQQSVLWERAQRAKA